VATRQADTNAAIDAETEERVRRYATADPGVISERIDELEREWDIERWLETNASLLALAGVALGAFVHRRWLLLPALVLGFPLQHALQGWCPPIEVLRRLGVRTRREIDWEKFALKALRGDFLRVSAGPVNALTADDAVALARAS
jgi:hypothetical protein